MSLALFLDRDEDNEASDISMQCGGLLLLVFGLVGARSQDTPTRRDLHMDVTDDAFGVRVHADDFCQLELPPKGILVTEPDYVSNSNVSFCCVPFAADE